MAVVVPAALLLESLRNQYKTSIWGRRLGLDNNDFVIGLKGLRTQVEVFTTTAASSASPFGTTVAAASGSSQESAYTLQAIPVGGEKILRQVSSSTAGQMFTPAAGVSILTASDGSSLGQITLYGNGASAILQALSSLYYAVISQTGTTQAPLVLYSTTS